MEESTQKWTNRAGLYIYIYINKAAIRKYRREFNCHLVLCDYCAPEQQARINNLTAKDLFQLQGTIPVTATFGDK